MTEFAVNLQIVRDYMGELDAMAVRHSGDLPELYGDIRLTPDLFAQILMNHLPHESRMEGADKTFWLAVAEAIGPDHIHVFKHVGAFMAKVNEF